MRKLILVLPALAMAFLWSSARPGCPTCRSAQDANGWCEACGIGYVGDVALRSEYLWHVLDAHGHTLNVEDLDCAGCVRAFRQDGFCEESRIGFRDGEAYFSRLTWLLAQTELRDDSALRCERCGDGRTRQGWCEACGRGWVGRRALADRARFDALRHEVEILERANRAAARCEHCAAAIVTDTECPKCRIRYRDGEAVTGRPAAH